MALGLAEAVDWQVRAACKGPQRAVFFPPPYVEKRADKRQREVRAKEICETCMVQQPCLDYALKIREQHGIWGGKNEIERREILRKTRLKARH